MQSDPVAAKSAFLCMYMTNHPDTLVAYVMHFGGVPGHLASAQMKSIDCQGMHLSYSLKNGGVGSVRIKFDPPLAGDDDVKPRLLAMKADAQEALGMLQTPKITSFRFPLRSLFVLSSPLGIAYFTWAPPQGAARSTDVLFAPAHTVVRLIGFQPSMTQVLLVIAVAHVVETLYTWHLCRRHVVGPSVKAVYLFATLVCGFPIWTDLRKRIQEMRIDSVMKAE